MDHRIHLAVLVTLFSPVVMSAQTSRNDPDSPEMHARAKAALSRAQTRKVIGITRGVDALLRDLDRKSTRLNSSHRL